MIGMKRFLEFLMVLSLIAGFLLSVAHSTGWWFFGSLAVAGLLQMWTPNTVQNEPEERHVDTRKAEESTTREHDREIALRVYHAGGYLGVLAKSWLDAYDDDPTVPTFGVRPYWAPNPDVGIPTPVSYSLSMSGVERRLDFIRHASNDDVMIEIMTDDPNPRVSSAAYARLRRTSI